MSFLQAFVALLVLSLPVFAQSGTVILPTSTTDNSIALTIGPPPAVLPPAGAGMTRLRLNVSNAYTQGCTVTNTYPSGGVCTARWGNVTTLRAGSLELASFGRRESLIFPFGVGVTSASMVNSHSLGSAFSLNILPIAGPLYLDSDANGTALFDLALEEGTLSYVLSSASTATIEYEYLP